MICRPSGHHQLSAIAPKQIQIVEGEIPGVTNVTGWDLNELRYKLEAAIREMLEKAEASDATLSGKDLVSQLEFSFRGDSPLSHYLGVADLFDFIKQVPGITTSERDGGPVALGEKPPFGRAIVGGTVAPPTESEFNEWLRVKLSDPSVSSAGVPLTSIGQWARTELKLDAKVNQVLGYATLTQLLQAAPGVEIIAKGANGLPTVRLAGFAEAAPEIRLAQREIAAAHATEFKQFGDWLMAILSGGVSKACWFALCSSAPVG